MNHFAPSMCSNACRYWASLWEVTGSREVVVVVVIVTDPRQVLLLLASFLNPDLV